MKINILTSDVYNRIAAGEVVDRPYSVVKELVENAIDAGASEITIEITKGGKERIRVSDNGGGMDKDDLKAAYLPHATSKLCNADDLEHIVTLGFRGEAIASIAAVSRMQIVTKAKEQEAYALSCNFGVIGQVEKAASADGTTVTVENLFENTPARLKFLKSDSQEEGDVTNMAARFILSRPDIAFTYLVNGKARYRSFGDGLDSALTCIYGTGILENCYRVQAEKHGVKLSGFLGNQNFSKPNRSYQSLFVNGRYVLNQTVSGAVNNAYSAYLMKRQYPFYVLFLDLPGEIVDVNVHPNKTDVRFADNQVIYGCVYSIVSAILDGNSRALEYLVPEENEQKAQIFEQTKSMVAEKSAPAPEYKTEKTMSVEEAKEELAFHVPPMPSSYQPSHFTMEVRSPLTTQQATGEEEDIFSLNKREIEALEQKKKQERVNVNLLVYKGDLFQTYLIYELGDDAYFIDQHAAHERLLFNRLQEKIAARKVVSQPMLVPFIYHANGQEFAFLQKNFPILEEIGFEIEEFGGTSVKISAVPCDLSSLDLNVFFSEMLSSLETMRAIKLGDLLRDKLASMACKAAVKGGEKLTDQEARALIEEMDGDMGLKCPHGRPVCVKMKKSEFEKLFKRVV